MINSANMGMVVENLCNARNLDEVHHVCSELTLNLGFTSFHYGTRLPTSFTHPKYIHINGYPEGWWDWYKTQDYLKDDPTVQYCDSHITPLIWQNLRTTESISEQQTKVMNEADEHGLAYGFSIPVHTHSGEFAMFSMAMDRSCRNPGEIDMPRSLSVASLLTGYIHERVTGLARESQVAMLDINLTSREQECLLWAAEGKTTWETSRILKISERTVVFHIQNAAAKLGVTSKQHAVAKAVSIGVISPF